ncbi:ParB/RepB/Spo0J family partition protein [Sphingomonas sp.]|uniref:ParB/RepB/Spo0J family partition protein n=1 Tax=Sphingomonas sp. TaxID=28214 RepID=UPI000DB1DA5D|nr:ParB/RepB/Spo0J family partition protein [Sphingomonas sp.]PZU11897.1 MAG: chromosome partitioning protein ParB [Sphingomonas sp.]
MNEVKRGLGRGLSALLGDVQREQPIDPAAPRDGGIRMIDVGAIHPNPDQPRRHFDETALEELAASLKARGLLQPIIVRTQDSGYQIVAGERRWRAAQRAQLHQVPAIVRTMNDAETLELAIIENIQRQDLNAIEEAEAYQRLAAEYGHTQEVLGKLVGKSRSHIANLLRLLDLPPEVRLALADGRLTMGHARALITAQDPAALAEQVIREGLSVRDTERLARQAKGKSSRPGPIEYKGSDADTEALERQLSDLLGLKVTIAHGPKGGTVTIGYSTLDQLDLICQRLNGGPI